MLLSNINLKKNLHNNFKTNLLLKGFKNAASRMLIVQFFKIDL